MICVEYKIYNYWLTVQNLAYKLRGGREQKKIKHFI